MITPSAPDSTAVRVALWRALHVEVDPPPHVLDDTVGLRHVSPDDLANRYFAGYPDGLRPTTAEHLVVATA